MFPVIHVRDPLLYQVNARVWLGELARALGRPATLDDIPDHELDQLRDRGFDLLYLLGVWDMGAAGIEISRTQPEWQEEFRRILPDLREEDICGSPFAVRAYETPEGLGGSEALGRLRARLHRREMGLILDFVPNHTALDHPWTISHPDFYVHGTAEDLERHPDRYVQLSGGETILAHGRDPHFPAWPDTLQLNYADDGLRLAVQNELKKILESCDGIRCDTAMLITPVVFRKTWGIDIPPFWPEAISIARLRHPGMLLIAEVYWNMEWELQTQGFDFTYDKPLYDRLRMGDAPQVKAHLGADLEFQHHSVRFLENHSEPRVAALLTPGRHRAAAVVAYLSPGLHFFHQGQLEGAKIRPSAHLCRLPVEPIDEGLNDFYAGLLECLRHPVVRTGEWHLLDPEPAWLGNWTDDCFVASCWEDEAPRRIVVVTNYADVKAQCYLPLPFAGLEGSYWRLRDILNDTQYDRAGEELQSPGLYLDLPPWGYHVFELVSLQSV